jgi:hypothetical protein
MSDSAQSLWPQAGYAQLKKDARGHLIVTDDFLRVLLLRPELAPIESSCKHEIQVHERLLENPRLELQASDLALVQDRDAADNMAVWMRFRNRILAHASLEASYWALFEGQGVDVPPVLVNQITQVLVQHVLGNDCSPVEARAAELLFRTQKISVLDDGSVMAADNETVERHALESGFGSVGELLKQGGIPLRSVDLDVIQDSNEDSYWDRSERFDMVACLNLGQALIDAFCRVLERWILHFTSASVRIATAREIEDSNWVWHVGLDAQASSMLNDLYTGQSIDEDRQRRMLCLFVLNFANASDMLQDVSGKPVYLAMAMDPQNLLKIKPQNLLLNLPLARRS